MPTRVASQVLLPQGQKRVTATAAAGLQMMKIYGVRCAVWNRVLQQ